MISPMTTMIYFFILTSIYFLLKYYLAEKYSVKDNNALRIPLTIIYLVIMLFIQISTNIANAREKCGGTPQTLKAINYTIGPNLLIFGSMLAVMTLFPGWKAPFSNTIGYMITLLGSVKTVFTSMLKTDSNNKLLKAVYRDPSMMINEITPENFNLFISRMGSSQNSILASNYRDYLPDLYDLVVVKDKVAEFLWYMLTGALVIQNSHTYIMSIKCKRTEDELEAKLTRALDNPKKEKKPETWTVGY